MSADAAREQYGVVLDPAFALDEAATEATRATLRRGEAAD